MGINISIEFIVEFASIYGCKKGEWPNMYLGLPLKGNHKFFSFWKIIIEKIERRLSTWSSRYTSKGGRLTLKQATLSNLPNYYMSLFEMPQKVVADIDRLFRNYLWKDSVHLVRWNIINLPTEKGGLGLLSIRKNTALLAKWIWRYHHEEKALWRNLIKAKYTPTSNKNHPLHLLQKGLEVHKETSKSHHQRNSP